MLSLNILQSTVTLIYLVYFQTDSPPTLPAIRQLYRDWIERHTFGLLQASLQAGSLQVPEFELGRPSDFPALHDCSCSRDCIEVTRRFKKATHVCLFEHEYRPGWPYAGYWSVLGAASALAQHVNGLMVELGTSSKLRPFTGRSDGTIRARDHILVLGSVDPSKRLGWVTTQGLHRLGLQELELVDVPPLLVGELGNLMNPLAERIVAAPDSVPEELDFQPLDALAPTRIRLVPGPTMTTVRPPRGTRFKSLRRWYERVLLDLYGR